MLKAQETLDGEIMVDNFAGGGGASTGIELALGRIVNAAINHDPAAILMHKTNHPFTEHYQASVWDVDPRKVCRGRPVALAWFSPDCFVAGTMILTERGYKPIEEVQVGDMVLTHKNRWRPVVETMVSKKETMLIRGYGNSGMICSRNHPFYVRKKDGQAKFTACKEIQVGDYWGIPSGLPEEEIPHFRGKAANLWLMWLAGRYVGDGWLRMDWKNRETVITCGKHDIPFLDTYLNSSFNYGLKWNFREVRTGGQYICYDKELTEWLYENFGKGSAGKYIPVWLMGAPDMVVDAFLEGYLGADGHVSKTTGNDLVEMSTVSKALAYGLVHLATTLGKSAVVYRQDESNDVIEGRKVNSRAIYKVRWRDKCDEGHRQTFYANGIQWRPIREIIPLHNELTVYNIGVEEDESYIAEGVIVHNCKHFSKAKGAALVDKRIRGLAWITLRWAALVRPRTIFLENVEEFQTWGPVRKGKPVKKLAGTTFKKFISQLRDLGYAVEWRELVAADYGAPTTRKRFVLIARCDGRAIVWPERTHAPRDSEEVRSGKLLPWRSAAEIIDWSLPCPSIFDSKAEIMDKYGLKAQRPLRPNTMRRIIRGVDKFTIKSGEPFLVGNDQITTPITVTNTSNSVGSMAGNPVHTVTTAGNQMLVTPSLMSIGHTGGGDRIRDLREPTPTTVSKQEACVVSPTLVQVNHSGGDRANGVADTMPTITAKHGYGVTAASLIQYHTEQTENVRASGLGGPIPTIDASNRYGLTSAQLVEYYSNGRPLDVTQPLHTVTSRDREAVVATHLTEFRKQSIGSNLVEPVGAVTSHDHEGVVAAHIAKFYGGVTGAAANEPMPTVTVVDHNALAAAHVVKFKGTNLGSSPADPVQTITAGASKHRACSGGNFAACKVYLCKTDSDADLCHWPEIRVLLNEYCGYCLAENDILLLEIGGTFYFIADIGLRMLSPRELYNAMGFPPDYIIEIDYKGNPYPKNEQVARCGNAVCPAMAAAVVASNLPEYAVTPAIRTMEDLMNQIAV